MSIPLKFRPKMIVSDLMGQRDRVDDEQRYVNTSSSAVAHNTLGGLQGGKSGQYYHLTNAQHTEIVALVDNTDITGAQLETLVMAVMLTLCTFMIVMVTTLG